jgi:hypothetical protein
MMINTHTKEIQLKVKNFSGCNIRQLHSAVTGVAEFRAIVRLEELAKLKKKNQRPHRE